MASMLSFLRRQQFIRNKKERSRHLLLESLEERLNLTANLLVTTTIAATEQVLREFTPNGDLVRTALLPTVSGSHEPGRDLIYDDQSGQVHAYVGTFSPQLSTYTLAGGGWTQRTHPVWSTVNTVSNGGIALWGDYVYVTDMAKFSKPGDEAKGVVRFNTTDGTSSRLLTTEAPQDLTIGHNGRLYLLSSNTVKSYDLETFSPLSTVSLPAGDFRGIAVNAAGEDGVLTVAAPGFLDNDTDADGDTLTAALVNGPSHGVLNLNADGSFTYTPDANYFGSDSFTYQSNDGESNSNPATVNITVNAVNDAPLAVDDAYSINEDQTLTIAPIPGTTSLTMISEPGDNIGLGQTYSYTPATGAFFANRNFDQGVSVF